MNGTRVIHKTAKKDISDTPQNIGETIKKILILCKKNLHILLPQAT
jgi:hypothetical protein